MAEGDSLLSKGRYRARLAANDRDLRAVQTLRGLCFGTDGPDRDAYDDLCRHVMIEDQESGALLCCFRMILLPGGAEIDQSYSAQFYDLERLRGFAGAIAEVGRFCIRDEIKDADILRLAWGAITALVEAGNVRLLFGCSSFAGTQAAPYLHSLALLQQRHLAPGQWRPAIRAAEVFRFSELPDQPLDQKEALRHMPPLLRTYLLMGGWVSDHAVVDRDLETLHVFTGVEIDAIPEGRKRLLRAVAAPA